MDKEVLKEFLEAKYRQYATADFFADDSIQIPHQFSKKQDIEIAGCLTVF